MSAMMVRGIESARARLRRVERYAVETARSLNGKQVKVAIPESAVYPNGKKVRDVAMFVEYGTANMAPRPFMREARAENHSKWWNAIRRGVSQVARGETTVDAALETVGEMVKADIQKAITDCDAVDTGRLRSSFEVQVQ